MGFKKYVLILFQMSGGEGDQKNILGNLLNDGKYQLRLNKEKLVQPKKWACIDHYLMRKLG